MTQINHPLSIGQTITAQRPSCACAGAVMQTVKGEIQKVITNTSGYWYYLSIGYTVKDVWITSVD